MGNLKINGCIRCKKGDIALDKDQYGWYEYCIQCGYMRELSDPFDTIKMKNKAAFKSHLRSVTLYK